VVDYWGSKIQWPRGLRPKVVLAFLVLAITLAPAVAFACDCGACAAQAEPESFSAQYDFFTNYGEYMPRMHCLRTEAGTPDWYWIAALITLNVIIMAGYVRIFVFWTKCYLSEKPCDRNRKLMQLAWMFALCAACGYGLSVVIFFWPAYRLLAIALVGLSLVTWRFAFDLEPFRNSFTAHRLQRQLNEALRKDNEELEEKHHALEQAHRELARTTDELRKTNADLDEFVYSASHDLKAPLRAIDSLAGFVLEDLGQELREESQVDLTELRKRVKRMERMLNGLLDYSRMRRVPFGAETFRISDSIDDAIGLLDIPAGFAVEVSDTELVAVGPRAPLELVLRNLIDNALKHHHLDTGIVHVSASQQGDFMQVAVSDDGPGIPAEFHDRVFGMFQTLRRRDELDTNGLGLALVKRTVEGHGGEITLESAPEEGTTFLFTWPLDHQLHDASDRQPAVEELQNV